MKKDDRVYFLHIRDAIERVAEYTTDGKDAFFADRKTQDAVVRNLEVIGEAVKHVSTELKAAHPDIPWQQIAGMRDKMIHEYFGVNLKVVWEVVARDLRELKGKILAILEDLG